MRTTSLPVVGITSATVDVPPVKGFARYAVTHAYVHCVRQAGGLPVLLPHVEPELASEVLSRLDGLLLSGGRDVDPSLYGEEPLPACGESDAARDTFEIALAHRACEEGLPLFAICRGVQLLNVARGGTLIQDVPTRVAGALAHSQKTLRWDAYGHHVDVVANTRLAGLAGAPRVRVNSDHHQAADRVADGLVVSARAHDGTVEALEDPRLPWCLGVQWHPERMPDDPLTRRLFADFVEAAHRRQAEGSAKPAAARGVQ